MFEYGEIGSTVIMVVTIATSLAGLYGSPKIIEKCLFRPYYFLRRKEYDTIYMSGFVHADLAHLLFNMITFYFFAFPLEFHLGTIPFLVLYVVGLIASHGCTWYKHKDDPQYASLGASGAISAVLFAYIVYFPTTKLLIFPIPIPIPAALFAIGYVAYSYWASTQARGRINHDAHLCGAISGIVFVAVTDPAAFAGLARAFG
ncbi:MAG: rhomboid family intramembrane serine protease [Woeseiaceae bacterium]